jgi:hypothetical protein
MPYGPSYYPPQQTYSTVNYRTYGNDYWQTIAANGPTPAGAFSNQVQQQQFPYQHQHHQPRFQMSVPENYQVQPASNGPSTVEPAPFSQTLSGNHSTGSILSKPLPKKQDEKQDKTVASVFSEKEAVVAVPAVSKTVMQISASQEKEEVGVIEQVDDVLVDSLVKQVSDLDIKQPIASVTKESSNNKDKQAVRKQQDTSRQKTVKEGLSNGKKSGRQSNKHNTSRTSTAEGNAELVETKSSREDGPRNASREVNSQKNNSNSARRNTPNNPRRNSGIVIPKADFDFASSNAKFDKTVIAKNEALDNENQTVMIPEADHFYDKVS